jgi:glutathione S-transferase
MAAMLLYGHPLSGNTHKVRLLLAALNIDYDEKVVDVTVGAHKQPDFVALNPRGQVPVLTDGEHTIYDAQAMLVYLARRYDPANRWLPTAALEMARVVGWLSFAANELHSGAHVARMHCLLGVPTALEQAQALAVSSLHILDGHLRGRTYLELERPTIADLACFPSAALAPEGRVALDNHPHVSAWIDRIKTLPRYVGMAGLARQGPQSMAGAK